MAWNVDLQPLVTRVATTRVSAQISELGPKPSALLKVRLRHRGGPKNSGSDRVDSMPLHLASDTQRSTQKGVNAGPHCSRPHPEPHALTGTGIMVC